MVETVKKLCTEARLRLSKRDEALTRRMLQTEEAYKHLSTIFEYEPGQLVLVRTKRLGKLKTRAEGPY